MFFSLLSTTALPVKFMEKSFKHLWHELRMAMKEEGHSELLPTHCAAQQEQKSVLKPEKHKVTALLMSQSHRESNQSSSGSQIWQHFPCDRFCAGMAKMKEELQADLKDLQIPSWF